MSLEGTQAGRLSEGSVPVQPSGLLPPEVFLQVITHAPLVSIDLLVTDSQGRTLVGRRINPPAAASWFAPGGRVRKDETLDAAFLRLTEAELGVALPRSGGALDRCVRSFLRRQPVDHRRPGAINPLRGAGLPPSSPGRHAPPAAGRSARSLALAGCR